MATTEQYATDANLRARQRLWDLQDPPFDLVGWVLDLAELDARESPRLVLDLGCGNGSYLRRLGARDITAIGCDLSVGMLAAAAPHPALVNADAVGLPFPPACVDVVLAPHMLYHVDDRETAAREVRRVLRPGGTFVAVTNGAGHTRAVRDLVERAVQVETPGWQMRNPSMHSFSLENGEAQLRTAFDDIELVLVTDAAPVTVTDATVVADYVASVADPYARETSRPWADVVESVRVAVQRDIDERGAFVVTSHVGAFVCR